MSSETNQVQELPVTFKPQLYLQRRGWVLDMMRREGVREASIHHVGLQRRADGTGAIGEVATGAEARRSA